MFWNSEFLNASHSQIDVLLQMPTVELHDILFEDDLLQELKVSNVNLANFLNRPDIIAQLVDYITQLTEKDCCDKLLYSKVHAAYISCEILTSGSSEIFAALMNHPESLKKIISCLTIQLNPNDETCETTTTTTTKQPCEAECTRANAETNGTGDGMTAHTDTDANGAYTEANSDAQPTESDQPDQSDEPEQPEQPDEPVESVAADEPTKSEEPVQPEELVMSEEPAELDEAVKSDEPLENANSNNDSSECYSSRVIPQKATLVGKLISTIHSSMAANLSVYITKDMDSFSRLIDLLTKNIDVSGSFEILSTFIKRTEPPELRYVFCEILSNLKFVQSLVDVMTLSDVEDKQRNACQLLCDIINIGRQDAADQTGTGPVAQDMLAAALESAQTTKIILSQMFSHDKSNQTAIVSGMKVLQTLLDEKPTNTKLVARTIEQIQEEIEVHLIKFHELLLNPPKQEPIKTTFGVIQKPLGYMRLEVVNLIRALISTNSPNIIKKLVELKTMKVIIDLFIDYSWNNLLHTQVEQALCLIINNCRHDEELSYSRQRQYATVDDFLNATQAGMTHMMNGGHDGFVSSNETEAKIQDVQEVADHPTPAADEGSVESEEEKKENVSPDRDPSDNSLPAGEDGQVVCRSEVEEEKEPKEDKNESEQDDKSKLELNEPKQEQNQDQQTEGDEENRPKQKHNQAEPVVEEAQLKQSEESRQEQSTYEFPSLALLSQLLNECDLIGRLLTPNGSGGGGRRFGGQANFGHIIQMINSIAINRDLDTIREHLDRMKDERPELYDRWTTFVNDDVASFKEITLFYDAQSASNNVSQRQISNGQHLTTSADAPEFGSSIVDDTQLHIHDRFLAYLSFARENVIPTINADVLPRSRRAKESH